VQDLVEEGLKEAGVRRLLRVSPEAALAVGVLLCEKRGRAADQSPLAKGTEEEGEVDIDGLEGVGREEVPGDDEADEVEQEEGEQDSEPGAAGGEEEEGETEEESSSGEERSPPEAPSSPSRPGLVPSRAYVVFCAARVKDRVFA
jgi:hypothetical protein